MVHYCINPNCRKESKHLVQVTRETGEEMLISICDPEKEDCRAVLVEHADRYLETGDAS
jgi:hypothetical protein